MVHNQDNAKPSTAGHYALWGGVALILVGLIFLFRNLTSFTFDRWWALFILVPAVASLANAWRLRRSAGRWTLPARRMVMTGIWIAAAAFIFLLGLEWAKMWPVFLVFLGLWALLNAALPKE